MTNLGRLRLFTSTVALAACGADDVASPGEGNLVVIPAPTPSPSPTPSPTPTPTPGTPAASCPAQTTDRGIVGTRRDCEISGTITGQRLIQNLPGVVYSLAGRVQVGTDCGADPASPIAGCATGQLTIDPGVVI